MKRRTNRRNFLKGSAAVGAGYWIASSGAWGQTPSTSPNEQLNFACIGVGGKGDSDTDHVGKHGKIVALCDIDSNTVDRKGEKYKSARKYFDYREMFEEMGDEIDAVTVSTPDHHHAPAAMLAMKNKKHVYCQKPLTHSVFEARALREAAKKYGVKTQMGNQGTATDGLRKGVEAIRGGALGKVREVHVWTNRPIWPQAPDIVARPKEVQIPPPNIHWNLFLGPAPKRPYNSVYQPFKWRGWLDYGTGALGDMGCHTANLAFMALKLEYPTGFVGEGGDVNLETYPSWASVTYDFPARGDMPAIKFYWYEGHKPGKVKNLPPQELIDKVLPKAPPSTQPGEESHHKKEKLPDSGLIVVGDEGILYSPNDYGADWKLLPEDKFKDYKFPEPTLPRLSGGDNDENNKIDWINAIKAGGDAQSLSHFGYGGLLTETILLGNVAIRAGGGNPKPLLWDGPGLRITNDEEANKLIATKYREGWSL